MYRFTVARRSDVRVRLQTSRDFRIRLLTDGGHRIATGSGEMTRRLAPGRYFVAVEARDGAHGNYVLSASPASSHARAWWSTAHARQP